MTIVTFVVLMCYGGGVLAQCPAVCRGLFWTEERRPDLWVNVERRGVFARRGRGPLPNRTYARDSRLPIRGPRLHIIAGVMAVSTFAAHPGATAPRFTNKTTA